MKVGKKEYKLVEIVEREEQQDYHLSTLMNIEHLLRSLLENTNYQSQDNLSLLHGLNNRLSRPYLDRPFTISDSSSDLVLNYRGRKHLFISSPQAIVLNLLEFGILSCPPNTWMPLSYRAGMQIFTIGTTTPVQVWIRATDEAIPVGSVISQKGFVERGNLTAQGTNAFLLPITDVSAYNMFSIYFPPQSPNYTVGFFHSNSPTVVDIPLQMQRSDGVRFSSIANPSDVLLSCPIFFRYLAVSLSFYGGGVATAIAEFYTQPITPLVVNTVINDTNSNPLLGNQASINTIFANPGTGTVNSSDITNPSSRGIIVYVNVTTIGTGSLVLHIQGKDLPSGNYVDLLVATTPLTANGEVAYELYPGISGGSVAQAVSGILPHDFRLQVTGLNGTVVAVNYALEM